MVNGRHRQQVDAENSTKGGGRCVCICFDRTPALGFVDDGRPCQAHTLIVKM